MTEQIFTPNRLIIEAADLRKTRFTPGCDNVSANEFFLWLLDNAASLCEKLAVGDYLPRPVTCFRITTKSGKQRTVSRLTAADTVIQRCILDALSPECEPLFSESSFAYRAGRGTVDAAAYYAGCAAQMPIVLKLDVKDCFDNIDHALLINALRQFGVGEGLAKLVMRFVSAPRLSEEGTTAGDRGLAQGAPLSPLLCNVYLHKLDSYLDALGVPFCRYADDVAVFAPNEDEAVFLAGELTAYMESALLLTVNPTKQQITDSCGISYVGFSFIRTASGAVQYQPDTSESPTVYRRWTTKPTSKPARVIDIVSEGILSHKDNILCFENGSRKIEQSAKQTECLNLFSNVQLSQGVLELACRNHIQINFFSSSCALLGSFIPNSSLFSPKVTVEQLRVYGDSAARLHYAVKIVRASIHNTRLNLRYYIKHNDYQSCRGALEQINSLDAEIAVCDSLEHLLLLEAKVRKCYYGCFDDILSLSDYSFVKRSRQPPCNEVNALMSFGYTVLYNLIATEINKTALDVRVGFLHATNRRRMSLNLDLAEVFKPLVIDRVIFRLLNKHMLGENCFDRSVNGRVYLHTEGKRIFLREIAEKLETSVTVGDASLPYITIIRNEINGLVDSLRGVKEYKPFKQVR